MNIERAIREKKLLVERTLGEIRLLEQAHKVMSRDQPEAAAAAPAARAPKSRTRTRRNRTRKPPRATTPVAPSTPAPANVRPGGLRPDSYNGLTVTFLREHGKPAHVSRILEALAKKGKQPDHHTFNSRLAKAAKKGWIFFRTQPATYGLLEWRQPELGLQANGNGGKPPKRGRWDDVPNETGDLLGGTEIIRDIVKHAPDSGLTAPRILELARAKKPDLPSGSVHAIIFRLRKAGEIQADGGRGNMVYRTTARH